MANRESLFRIVKLLLLLLVLPDPISVLLTVLSFEIVVFCKSLKKKKQLIIKLVWWYENIVY